MLWIFDKNCVRKGPWLPEGPLSHCERGPSGSHRGPVVAGRKTGTFVSPSLFSRRLHSLHRTKSQDAMKFFPHTTAATPSPLFPTHRPILWQQRLPRFSRRPRTHRPILWQQRLLRFSRRTMATTPSPLFPTHNGNNAFFAFPHALRLRLRILVRQQRLLRFSRRIAGNNAFFAFPDALRLRLRILVRQQRLLRFSRRIAGARKHDPKYDETETADGLQHLHEPSRPDPVPIGVASVRAMRDVVVADPDRRRVHRVRGGDEEDLWTLLQYASATCICNMHLQHAIAARNRSMQL